MKTVDFVATFLGSAMMWPLWGWLQTTAERKGSSLLGSLLGSFGLLLGGRRG